MSQTIQILNHLKKSPITPLDALSNYGCMRLAARINDLRFQGYLIETDMKERDGKRFASYRLVKNNGNAMRRGTA